MQPRIDELEKTITELRFSLSVAESERDQARAEAAEAKAAAEAAATKPKLGGGGTLGLSPVEIRKSLRHVEVRGSSRGCGVYFGPHLLQ